AMRGIADEMIATFPDDQFDVPVGDANSAKWIAGHLALGMGFGLNLLGVVPEEIAEMMPTYGPGSPGGAIGDDGRDKASLLAIFRGRGEELKAAVAAAAPEHFQSPNTTPFLAKEMPTVGDLLAHVYTTHITLHAGQLSQMRRQLGLPSMFAFT
ncbi:MAG: DinB family protein, partial [Planctomycetota bacterium]